MITLESIKTADHADLPPIDEETGQRNPWFIVYNKRGIPRYLAVESIAALEHSAAGPGAKAHIAAKRPRVGPTQGVRQRQKST
jgi:hypothetical protein